MKGNKREGKNLITLPGKNTTGHCLAEVSTIPVIFLTKTGEYIHDPKHAIARLFRERS